MSSPLTLLGDLVVLGFVSILVWTFGRRKLGRLPPGPRPLPFIGNLFDTPKGKVWSTYRDWRDKYGPLCHIRTLGQSVIIISELDMVLDLFEKRSSNYSDKVMSSMTRLGGWDWALSLMPYGVSWRMKRKQFHQKFHPAASAEYHNIQENAARNLARSLLENPSRLSDHLMCFSASIVLEVAYGHKVEGESDQLVKLVKDGLGVGVAALNFPRFLVNVLPFLEHLPTWVPGTGEFRRIAKECKLAVEGMKRIPFEECLRRVVAGDQTKSYTSEIWSALDASSATYEEDVELLRDTAAMVYVAGAETTVTSLMAFFLLMVAHPEAQRRAQKELDEVLGCSKLCTMGDREDLPYIVAIAKEVMRFMPAVSSGVRHATTKADVFRGYNIPANAIVIADSWGILHSPGIYSDPFTFNPDRFLGPNCERDPFSTGVFGFGRRVCPGRFLADASMFIVIATVLSCFDITHAVDENGQRIEVTLDITPGFISHPVPFQYKIIPRKERTERLAT